MRTLCLLLCLGRLLAGEVPAQLPDFERFHYKGSYMYGGQYAVTCTLRRVKPPEGQEGALKFKVFWLAHWPHGSKEEKWGANDKGWYYYEGPLSIAADGSVTGKSKYHKLSGKFIGEFPRGKFDLEYTGGRNKDEKIVKLEYVPKPKAVPQMLIGKVEKVDWKNAFVQVTAKRLDKRRKALDDEDVKLQLVVDHKTRLKAGRYELGLGWLNVGQQVKCAGWKMDEGILVNQVAQPDPPKWTGEIVKVGNGSVVVKARLYLKRKDEPQEMKLGFKHAVEVKPISGRPKTVEEGLKALEAGQKCDFGGMEANGGFEVVWFKAKRY